MFKIFLLLGIFIITSTLPVLAYAENDTIISIDFIGSNVIDLQNENRLIRANVNIENYNASDWYYFMKISNNTGGFNISEIFPNYKTGGLWQTQIGYLIDDTLENMLGEHSITIYTEFGPESDKAIFSIINSTQNNQIWDEIYNPLQEYRPIQELIESKKENNNVKSTSDKFRITYTNTSDDEKIKEKEIHTVNRPEPSYSFIGTLENIKTTIFWFWK